MIAYVTSLENPTRKAQGWSDTRVQSIERRVIPPGRALNACYQALKKHKSDIHFFGSPFQDPTLMMCLLMAVWLNLEFYLVSEPYSPGNEGYLTDGDSSWTRLKDSLKAKLRPFAYRLYALALCKRFQGVFAISRLSLVQYLAAGIPRKKLYPFGYFVPEDGATVVAKNAAETVRTDCLKLVFVGALIRRKGVDLLAGAVQQAGRSGCKVGVDVYGAGKPPPSLKNVSEICLRGTIPFGQAAAVIAKYDLLVLPSLYDGWGVVVNEALSAGVPVLTSDLVGAGCVAAELGAGLTFTAGSAESLASAIKRLADDPALLASMRHATVHAARLLQPDVAAKYMWDVICADENKKANVLSPWYPPEPIKVRVHLTNVAGVGASQLLMSLLPALERNAEIAVTEIHLPDRGPLSKYMSRLPGVKTIKIKRALPNPISRVIECLWSSHKLSGRTPILVLGDLPLRCRAPQTLFVQNAHILKLPALRWSIDEFKFTVSRWIFQLNAKYVGAFIVQTDWMREALADSYPSIATQIHVVAQPVPEWLLGTTRALRPDPQAKLRLLYPSAGYPHKNHNLLAQIEVAAADGWPIDRLQLTLPQSSHPAPGVQWIECTGFLKPEAMIAAYQSADALVFLSTKESLGFPLIEAMFLGLPIVCADLPYAHALCSDGAIYFDPYDIQSLKSALTELQIRLRSGWTPDWTRQLQRIPKNWDNVATAMVDVMRTNE